MHSTIQERLKFLKANRDTLVVDGDTHLSSFENMPEEMALRQNASPNYFQGKAITIENLIAEMDMAGVHVSLSWQNPAVTHYTTDQAYNFESLKKANDYIQQAAEAYPTRIIPAGWTDPKALGAEGAKKMVDYCIHNLGFVIVKMNPAQNAYRMDSDEIVDVLDHIVGQGAIPAFHFGGDTEFTPASALRKIAMRHPDSPVIAVHMGGGGSHYVDGDNIHLEARELGLECPNIFYILSAKRDCHIESDLITYQLASDPYSRNIACASDAPNGRQSWNFGGYERMFKTLMNATVHTDERVRMHPDLFTKNIIQNYLGRNLIDLVVNGYANLIQKHKAAATLLYDK